MTGKIAALSAVPGSRREVQVVGLICVKCNPTGKQPRRNINGRDG